jgi:chloramphenicol-sensitive protein RarD
VNTGVIYSVVASAIFALMPAYLQLLPPIHSFAVIGQRIIWTVIIMSILLIVTRQLKTSLLSLSKAKNWPGLIAGSLLIGSMWGLFVWAPLNGETLSVALGFFLAPLVLVLIGLVGFKDRLNALQWLATAVATMAVASSIWFTGRFSWIALAIATGYSLYFVIRRLQPIPVIPAFFIENILLLPLALWACVVYGEVTHPFSFEPGHLLMFFGLAMLGTSGMLCFLAASKRLSFVLFGLLAYLEPLFIFLVAISLIGEKIRPGEGLTYLFICVSICILGLDGIRHLLQEEKNIEEK